MGRVTVVVHDSKQIIDLEFRDCDMDQALQVIAEGAKVIRALPLRSALILSDFTNATHDARLSLSLGQFMVGNEPCVKASAAVGVTGMKRVLFDAVMKFSGRNLPIFDTVDQAKDWLAAQKCPAF